MLLVNISDLLHFQNVLLNSLNIYPLYLEVVCGRFMQRFLYLLQGSEVTIFPKERKIRPLMCLPHRPILSNSIPLFNEIVVCPLLGKGLFWEGTSFCSGA